MNKENLLARLKEKREDLKKRREQKIKNAREADSAVQSWSSSGLRNDLENERQIIENQLEIVAQQIQEIEGLSTTLLHSNVVVVGSLLTLTFDGGEAETFLLLKSPGDPELGIVSTSSPIGRVILGQRIGQKIKGEAGEEIIICQIRS